VAGRERGPAHRGRAHARHRRARQDRDLRAHEHAHRGGQGHLDDLLRAAGGAGHERPRAGDARRPHRGRAGLHAHHAGGSAVLFARTGAAGVLRTAAARRARELGTLVGLVLLVLLLSVLTPHFLSVSNLLNVMEQTSINAVIALGMTFVILSGGIDLSVGSLLALSGVVLAWALQGG